MLTDQRLKEIKYRHIEEGLAAGANGAIFELIGEIERLNSQSGWQPIETAPRDGTHILLGVDIATVWIVRNGRYDKCEHSTPYDPNDEGWWCYRHSVTQEKLEGIYEPTHWMPMPDEPDAS
jgi:hypothetical protein